MLHKAITGNPITAQGKIKDGPNPKTPSASPHAAHAKYSQDKLEDSLRYTRTRAEKFDFDTPSS